MTETLPITAVIGGFLLIQSVVLVMVLFRLSRLANADADRLQLLRLLENVQTNLNQGLADSRKELRDVSAENRRKLQEVFKNLQDTLLKRVSETSGIQIQQLNAFKAALTELSEKLINNSNEFKTGVSESFQATGLMLHQKQDEFRDKTLERLNGFESTIKNDAKTNRLARASVKFLNFFHRLRTILEVSATQLTWWPNNIL